MITIFCLLISLFLLYIHYQPFIEKLENGDWVMWYNSHENNLYKKDFILIKKRNKYD